MRERSMPNAYRAKKTNPAPPAPRAMFPTARADANRDARLQRRRLAFRERRTVRRVLRSADASTARRAKRVTR